MQPTAHNSRHSSPRPQLAEGTLAPRSREHLIPETLPREIRAYLAAQPALLLSANPPDRAGLLELGEMKPEQAFLSRPVRVVSTGCSECSPFLTLSQRGHIEILDDSAIRKGKNAAVHDTASRILDVAGRSSSCFFIGNGCRTIAEAASVIAGVRADSGAIGWLALSRQILSAENRERLLTYLQSRGVSCWMPERICVVDSITFPVRSDRRFTPDRHGQNTLFFVAELMEELLVRQGLSASEARARVVPIGLPECKLDYGAHRVTSLAELDRMRGVSEAQHAIFVDPWNGEEHFRNVRYCPAAWNKFVKFDPDGAPSCENRFDPTLEQVEISMFWRRVYVRHLSEQIAYSRSQLA